MVEGGKTPVQSADELGRARLTRIVIFPGGTARAGGAHAAGLLRHNDKVFSVRSLGLAIAGAVTLLLILKAMRKAVGPLRHGKSPSRRRE
jgi:hypothetical protein